MGSGRFFVYWMVAFLGFPLGGLLAILVVGSIGGLVSGALAGVLAGAVIGTAQWLALRGRLEVNAGWIPATALGLGVGDAVGAALTGAGTSIVALVVTGVAAGVAVGASQWMILTRDAPAAERRRLSWWPAVVAVAWPLGWTVTWAVGVDVERGYAVFGASGALVFAAVTGAALLFLRGSGSRL